ncbi:Zinc finger MYND domain-containing protein 10 [Mactra antiquata]
METKDGSEITCRTCNKLQKVMKMCTRCKSVMYCSRECQVKDWQNHRSSCNNPVRKTTKIVENSDTFDKNDNSIFSENGGTKASRKEEYNKVHHPLVDFTKAISDKKKQNGDDKITKPDGKCYLFFNKYYTDVPEVDESQPVSSIVVKCNKEKHKLDVQNSWTGVEIYEYLSYVSMVPLEKLKVIHKGKVLSWETIQETLKDKAVYQVIGETAESEDNLDQRDIAVLMKQTGLDRNTAVQSLKKKGDLLDALLDQ